MEEISTKNKSLKRMVVRISDEEVNNDEK